MAKKPNIAPRRPPDVQTLEARTRFVTESPRDPNERSEVQTSKHSRSVVQRKDGRQLKRATVYLPVDLARQLAVHCAETDGDLSATVALAITRYLDSAE